MRIVVIAVCLLVSACGWDRPDPGTYTPSPGYPCGTLWVPCFDMDGSFDHTCCPQNDTCGGGKWSVGCPANECCDIDMPPPDELRAHDGGAGLHMRRIVR